ncbi:G1/S-specific cyclin-E [Ditylenchus destructor]|uniref:G1/S-specific cyclin-E n=1 Tax=Ditylenchus destructor TaxID=166010 RepID=A0AAD4N249_9BILA|nr:G1/S-specific cyclin-E [Ditylenchus destructor]
MREVRSTPPQLDASGLGSPDKVWSSLCDKDEKFRRNRDFFDKHPKVKPEMRAMLIEWLMEVCADRRLHRETFHLCIDYMDRYMDKVANVDPSKLQLIASTTLVIATKVEEIYPPKIYEIAEYTDGSCSETAIRDMEEIMLQKLNWECSPITAAHWLSLFLQLMNANEITEYSETPEAPKRQRVESFTPSTSFASALPAGRGHLPRVIDWFDAEDEEVNDENIPVVFEEDDSRRCISPRNCTELLEISYLDRHVYPDQRCIIPKLMRDEFVRLSKILDLIILDVESLNFKYSELAAALVFCCYEPEHLIQEITGFRASQLVKVRLFVESFVRYCECLEPAGVTIPYFCDVHRDDFHNIQTHVHKAIEHVHEIKTIRELSERRRKENEEAAFRHRKRKLCEYSTT